MTRAHLVVLILAISSTACCSDDPGSATVDEAAVVERYDPESDDRWVRDRLSRRFRLRRPRFGEGADADGLTWFAWLSEGEMFRARKSEVAPPIAAELQSAADMDLHVIMTVTEGRITWAKGFKDLMKLPDER